MTSIFISYSRRDIDFANRIAAELRARGADVFIDYQKLKAGNFVSQLGYEIENREYFILIVSPNSVSSKWVQAEVTLAFLNDKKVIPIILNEPDSYAPIFPVVNRESVDCKRWHIDRNINKSIEKLARLLGLPNQPVTAIETVEDLPKPNEEALDNNDESEEVIIFAPSDITELFFAAVETTEEDPDRALYLYERVLELDPEHGNGNTKDMVEREKRRLIPTRLKQAEAAFSRGDWEKVLSITQKIIDVHRRHNDAIHLRNKAYQNQLCQSNYEHALIAIEQERWKVAVRLLEDVYEQCPDYGDPHNIISNNLPTANVRLSVLINDLRKLIYEK